MDAKYKIKERLADKIIDWKEQTPRRVYFSVKKEDIFNTVKIMFGELSLRFATASGVDTPEGFEILYHFSHDEKGAFYSVRVFIEDRNNPQIDSITPLFSGAEWIEREIWEMLGINFKGHPNLKRLLLAEDWPEGDYPLRQKK